MIQRHDRANGPGDVTVFLDLDGCILDSSRAIPAAMNRALDDLGLSTLEFGRITPLIGPPLELFAVDLVAAAGGTPDQAQAFAVAYLRRYEQTMSTATTMYPGMVEAIDDLRRMARVEVVTMKREDHAVRLMSDFGLNDRISAVLGTRGGEAGKAALLARALTEAGTAAARAVMVGDQPDDVTAARACGIPAIAVTWGFGSVAALHAAGADLVVDSPTDLPDAVRGVVNEVAGCEPCRGAR